MTSSSEIDEVTAMEVLRRLVSAVFDKGSVIGAMILMSPECRREQANDWVVGELEFGELLRWDERDEVTEALASLDKDHWAWSAFASETLASWQESWKLLPVALDDANRGRGPVIPLHLGRHRTAEELRATGVRWTVSRPSGPDRAYVYFEETDGSLLIADIIIVD